MGFDSPSPPPPPPRIIEPIEPEVDVAELARQRRELERKRVGRSALRIDPTLSPPSIGAPSTGVRIPSSF